MLIVMERQATAAQIDAVVAAVERNGCVARAIPGGERVSIGVLHNRGPVEPALFLGFPGVKEVIPVTRPYKLVSRECQPTDTCVRVGDTIIGNGHLTLIAGPCAIENEDQALTIAHMVKAAGAGIFRGGAFKPRTSPYSFQGLGEEGLRILEKVRSETGMPVITEVLDESGIDQAEDRVDILQIGTRNMQNFSLLRRAGRSSTPVMLKRGMAATIDEWFMAAEYILEGGNENVILCERGVRTFVKHSRNTLDISAIPYVRNESHLPILVDPSHAAGRRDQVAALGLAAVAGGAHGLMVEVHHEPERAMSDGAQSLYPAQFAVLADRVRRVHALLQEEGAEIS